ncbi:MAG: ACT domain-containing protein, partial [Alphaproteobacteria bacterium]|nr:ACT domain-containing protein [Alphaproteobacteria bacterium]
AFAKMKKGVRIVNCARGGLIDEAALKEALESGHVAGAALDVFAVEPAKENALFGMEQVIVTPHLGASTTEAQEKVAVQVAEQMADYLLTGAVTNALNMPSVSSEDAPKLAPYMKLTEQIGQFAGQITETGLKAVTIEYSGHAATLNTKPLTAIVLEGLLSPLMDTVNMVNAPIIAKDRGISVTESTVEGASDYPTLVRLTVQTDRRERVVAGTLFGDHKPRVVQINDMSVEAEVAPHMLYLNNEDEPGLIGDVGTLLGDAGVNIATFHLGRSAAGGDALALIEVDEAVTDEVIEKLLAVKHIKQAKALNFV